MTPDRWRQIVELFQSVRESSADQGAELLAQADPELRREVESLLRRQDDSLPSLNLQTITLVQSGTQLGPYRLQSKIGEGGMGEVFRGIDTRLDRPVAIKVVHQQFNARFEREARAISSLNHPHICTLYDIGPNYLVMELLEGETIAARLKSGPLPVEEALRYAAQITAALADAHERGIVHRDLKPGNIMLTKGGAKILDFGLATREGDDTLTATRMVIGTPAYMAPEQREGKPADARTDIYSFGRVLYEMLTGTRASSESKPLAAKPLEQIVSRCLEVDPARRWQTSAELLEAIEAEQTGNATPAKTTRTWMVAAAAIFAIALIAGYFVFRPSPQLTEKDTIVLADFTNTTNDPVFDDTLRQGLAIQLRQSPFLSMISDEVIQKTLPLMGQPASARLTPNVSKEICERTGSVAVLEGSIASLGSKYVLGLRAKNCNTGIVLDEEQVQAARKEDVLDVLSRIAIKFRTKVGESLATVQQHRTPLEEGTTTSIEALKAYSAGWKHLTADHDLAGGVPLFKRAIEIDPNFALAHAALGFTFGLLSQPGPSAESNQKAYELRDHTSDRERFFIKATYETQVTGDLEKALQTCESWVQTYPRDKPPHGMLGALVYPTLGKFEKGVEVARQLVELDPDFAVGYLQLAFNTQFAGRVDESDKVLQRASQRKLEIPELAVQRYDIAFLKGDQAGMDREAALAQSAADDLVYAREGFVLAYSGRLKDARLMSQRAENLNQEPDQLGKKALFELGPALWDGFFGNVSAARKTASAVADLTKDRDVEYGAAFALALAGELHRSRELEKDLETNFPDDTAVKIFYLPAIRALLELGDGKPSKAIDLLQVSRPYDRGVPPSIAPAFIGPFYTVYVRGLAYLAAHQGTEAAAEFQKILDGRTIVASDPIGALAHLQLGRALALSGDKAKAKTAYQDFLTLWKDADADIPVLQQAKAEHAKLP